MLWAELGEARKIKRYSGKPDPSRQFSGRVTPKFNNKFLASKRPLLICHFRSNINIKKLLSYESS